MGFPRGFNPAINNARSDKLEVGMWKEAFHQRRCVIPMSLFYEWGPASGAAGGLKQAHEFHDPDEGYLWVAGIWEENPELGPCYSMVTTGSSPLMAPIHDRMPALLLRQAMERKGRSVAVRQGNEVEAAAGPAVAEFYDPASAADAKVGFAVEMAFAGMLMRRVRYFTAGAVIGSKECVELCFTQARYRFGPKRKTGARRMRGSAKEAAGVIWALRDCSQKERPEILPDA